MDPYEEEIERNNRMMYFVLIANIERNNRVMYFFLIANAVIQALCLLASSW